MATRKVGKKPVEKTAKKTAKKMAPARRAKATKASAAQAAPPKVRNGVITHTELASANVGATLAWCESVLGWKFQPPVPSPAGPYHMWRFDIGTGGGLRANRSPEGPGAVPYVEVKDIKTTFKKAIAAGATEMMRPEALPGGMGWIAMVIAPGGIGFGFWSPA